MGTMVLRLLEGIMLEIQLMEYGQRRVFQFHEEVIFSMTKYFLTQTTAAYGLIFPMSKPLVITCLHCLNLRQENSIVEIQD